MVRKKVKKTPARSKKKVSNKKEVEAEHGATSIYGMSVDDLKFVVEGMIKDALTPKHEDAPQQGETTAPVFVGFAGQPSGNQETASVQPPKALPEELQALHERMMSVFMPELQALEKRFGYSDFYRDLSQAYLSHAVRSMAAAVAERDPRGFSGKPVWWESRDDEIIANALYSRLASEMTSLRQLAKVRKPEAFDARQLIPCFSATNS